MSSKTQTTTTKEEAKPALVPKLRFPAFRGAEGWEERPLSEFMNESRLPGSKGNVAKKITVKLWGNGVFEKNDAIQGSVNTQYFRRKAGQFIYSKLDFLNQAFGIIPPSLDGFESTVDLPCFDIADGLNPMFLLEYVKRRDFYERLGETADGSRKARRIHAETFLSFPVALPIPAEQQKIAECLSSVDELIAAQARKVDALKTHKKGLMQQLFPREGETQPRLRFPEFQNAGEWVNKPLGGLCRIRTGKKDANEGAADGIYPFFTCAEKHIYSHNYSFDAEAILIAGNANVGQTNYYNGKFEAYQRTYVLTDFVDIYVPYLYSVLSANLRPDLLAQVQTSAMSYIRLPMLEEYQINAPSSQDEQQRIATCLSSLDALITAETQKHEALKTHKKGLMQQLFPSPEEVEA